MKNSSMTTRILWLVYLCVLGMLLPHTAWAFRNWEPEISPVFFNGFTHADLVAWFGAFAFESAIAVLTHKLAKHIEDTPKGKKWHVKFLYRYMNPIAFGLLMSTFLSALANLAHAVQFGRSLVIFSEWGIPSGFYSLAFGGTLPLISLVFARVLSNVVDDESGPNPILEEANRKTTELRNQLKDSERQLRIAEDKARIAEERFGAVSDLVKHLFADDKRQRILFARRQWPQLPNSAIAIIADASPAHVSEVLKYSQDILEGQGSGPG